MPARSKADFPKLLKKIEQDFPDINFEADDNFRWSSETQTVYYNPKADSAEWSLLHELGHMIKDHSGYKTDRRLVKMEVEAWEEAVKLSADYGITIDKDYIQDCMDSYRNWQYARSKCPLCTQTGVEKLSGHYHCINCQTNWKVTPNRFCRAYRKKQTA